MGSPHADAVRDRALVRQADLAEPLRGVFPSASATSTFCIGAGASLVWTDPEGRLVAVVRWIDGTRIDGFCERVVQAISTSSPAAD